MSKYTIFGAGPAGLYTAWRLITSGKLTKFDSLELIEWGNYSFEKGDGGTRLPAGRIATHHYKGDSDNSYVEIGGMRYSEWAKNTQTGLYEGHFLVTEMIKKLNLHRFVVPFLTTDDPLFYLRGKNFYQSQLSESCKAPYNTPGNNEKPADVLFANISKLMTAGSELDTRDKQCEFYSEGELPNSTNSAVYNEGENIGNIGYWNFFYDQAGNEGFNYAADAGGYSSNVINWNAANAAIYNGEFAPGHGFKTLKNGYSSLFVELYRQARAAASTAGIPFKLTPSTRLHSMWVEDGITTYKLATSDNPNAPSVENHTTDYAFLAMPRHSLELVAQATRYNDMGQKIDFLNADPVQNYLNAVMLQPSYKVAMFFDKPWWEDAKYPPHLIHKDCSGKISSKNVFGPTITDLPLRQVYYFGNNALGSSPEGEKVYGMLASYDDMRFTGFWREMEIPVSERRTKAVSQDYQPLEGGRAAPDSMANMIRLELAKVHYNDPNAFYKIPKPLETVFMDWGLNPFGAGYHAWAAHYDICDVMQKIRTPVALAGQDHNNVFIIGSAYSNDQAWVEGAFCTSESVLTEYLGMDPVAEPETPYPLICSCNK